MMAPAPADLVGRVLQGRYLVDGPLATGGMSRLYVASDAHLPRRVCIKVFESNRLSEEVVATVHDAFVQEAYTLSQLSHPNTLRIYDFGFLDQPPHNPYHVCELMEGGTLAAKIRAGGALSRPSALEVLRPIVGALGEAHARGIVHRDLKPANILIGSAGPEAIIKLADFGIASLPAGSLGASARVAVYSPGWAAPEQVRGLAVGPASDVYGLGLLWAFMRCGRRPFSDEQAVARAQQRNGPEHLRALLAAARVDAAEIEIVLRACHPSASERPAQASGLLAALEALAGDAPSTAPPAPPAETAATLSSAAPEAWVAGRRVRLLAAGVGELELAHQARLRVHLSMSTAGVHLHVRGVNCFIAKDAGRITRAVDIVDDAQLVAYAIDRTELARARLRFGRPERGSIHLVVDGVRLAVDAGQAPAAVLLEEGAELGVLVPAQRSTV